MNTEKILRLLEKDADTKNDFAHHCTCLAHAIWLLFKATDEKRENYLERFKRPPPKEITKCPTGHFLDTS